MKHLLILSTCVLTALGLTACWTTGKKAESKPAPEVNKTAAAKPEKASPVKKTDKGPVKAKEEKASSVKKTDKGPVKAKEEKAEKKRINLGDLSSYAKVCPAVDGSIMIYKFNPIQYSAKGYQLDFSDHFIGKVNRIGYFMRLTDKQDKQTWTYAEFDAFTSDLSKIGVPYEACGVLQPVVDNLEVFSNVPGVKTGKFAQGNIEFWCSNYGQTNVRKIPGASNDVYDFGDTANGIGKGYGSMQIHNFLNKQTVIAFNNHRAGVSCDLGMGNASGPNTDWTFSGTARNLKNAEIIVVVKGDLKETGFKGIDNSKIDFRVETVKAVYAPNEPIVFTFITDFEGQIPAKPYYITWTRTGDDKITEHGKMEVVPGKTATLTTKLAVPGFVRIQAQLRNHKGEQIIRNGHGHKHGAVFFDGGAGVLIDQLKPAVAEPADFDAFWTRQKKRLAAVPMKYKMKKVSKSGAPFDVYEVSVNCAGPRPVTGYLTIPAHAKRKSLPASLSFDGYGTYIMQAPASGPNGRIHFHINAHGYDLGKDAEYYKKFFESIRSNGHGYAFDPKQNSNPETAYFNGMALRVMRAIQFVKQLPQWNHKELSVAGGSQGGLQTIWAAALDRDVTDANSVITWCCDFAGPQVGRLGGWRPAYTPALRYYDCVFHAKRIKCPIVISRAGLGDYTCPPSGLAILYNNLNTQKEIRWYQGSRHDYVPYKPQIFTFKSK